MDRPELIAPRPVSWEEFPSSELTSPGVRVLPADHVPVHGTASLAVEYARRSGTALHLNVLQPPRPAGDTTRLPVIVHVQGSAWFEQDLGEVVPALTQFANRGFVVASVQYRPSTTAPFPAQVRDVGTAIRFLRRNAARFGIDPGRVAVWGDSSGGHTAVMVAFTDGDAGFRDPGEEPLDVRCVVDYYGPVDVSRMNCEPSTMDHTAADSPEGLLIGGHPVLERPDLVAPTVLTHHVGPASPPVLVVHGSKDRLVPFGQSVLLVDALQAAGRPVSFVRLEGADHGGPPFWSGAVLDLVAQFLTEHLRP